MSALDDEMLAEFNADVPKGFTRYIQSRPSDFHSISGIRAGLNALEEAGVPIDVPLNDCIDENGTHILWVDIRENDD